MFPFLPPIPIPISSCLRRHALSVPVELLNSDGTYNYQMNEFPPQFPLEFGYLDANKQINEDEKT